MMRADRGIEAESGEVAEREKTGAADEEEEVGYGRSEGLVRISGTEVEDKGDV